MSRQFTTFLMPCYFSPTTHLKIHLFSSINSRVGLFLAAILISIISSSNCHSDTPITPTLLLDDAISAVNVDQHIRYYADNQGNQQLSDMLSHPGFFVPLKEKRFSFRVHTHWYQVQIANPTSNSKQWYIFTGISSAPFLRAYWVNESGKITIISNSSKPTPLKERKVRYSGYTIPLKLQAEESGTLLVQYRSMANFPLTLRFYTENDFISKSLKLMLLNGIYIGVIAVCFFFFLIQFCIHPTRTLGYYTLFIFSLMAFMAQINGYGIQQLWLPLKPYGSLFTTFTGGSIYIWYFLFTARIFQLQQQNKKLYYILAGFSGAVLAVTALGVFMPIDNLLSLLIAIGLPWPSIAAFWAARQKHPSAKIFLMGSCIHCVMTYLMMLACIGVNIGDNQDIFALASTGLLVDIILFSVAIFFQQERIRKQYHHQVELRLSDIQSLTESEQLSAQMLSLSKQTTLQTATTIHDLLQPLASIRLTLSSQSETQATQNMSNALKYADTLLKSVLKNSKVDYQKIHENVKIKRLISDIATRHQPTFNAKSIELKVYCPDIEITCLPLVINRIIDNLLANALRYTDTGKVLLCGRSRANNRFLIQIWDTGRGIPPSKVKKILSPFKQLNKEDIENMGFGLGLFIVKSLCDEAHYTLDIRSKERHGSCFSILVHDTNI